MTRHGLVAVLAAVAVAGTGVVAATGVPAGSAAPAPVTAGPAADTDSPWPTMRHDLHNTGASPVVGEDPGGKPWSFRTGKGIFSTPVVGADGTIYVGSADHTLYGLTPDGTESWRFTTDGIIDTAPALLAPERGLGRTLVIGSGDERLYRVRTDPKIRPKDRVVWTFEPSLPPVEGAQLVSWWEGSPNVGPDGTIYQGNTGGGAYAINPDGTQKWAFQAQNSVWTVPALDPDGTTYWGSVDLTAFALNPDGTKKWQRTTLGYVTSSPALDTAGTLYLGSFDGNVYALNAADGSVKWIFKTGDHIYSSPALVENPDGALQQIVIGSTDGLLYGLSPDGAELWSYDTGAPIRSSPVVGQAPGGGAPIAYVGAGNGHLYAIDTGTGERRWAFDTTSREPELATRNQLNSSPALDTQGITIGSQDGAIWHVPYDYCLREQTDARCATAGIKLPDDGTAVFGVDVGGRMVTDGNPVRISPAGYLTGRLVVRRDGHTVPARMVPAPDPDRLVTVTPDFEREVSFSGDGRYVFIRPTEMLGPETKYTVTVSGVMTTGGPRVGNVDLGTGELEAFSSRFAVRTGDDGTRWEPEITDAEVSGLSLSRLAVPLPPMLTSVNQIGFDFYDWIGGPVRTDEDSQVLWFVGAKRERGEIVADPAALFAFPMYGRRRRGTFSWSAAGVNLWFTFGPVPLRRFDLRGTFDAQGVVRPDSQFLAEAVCADTPGYGARLPVTGMCDTQGVITAAGTFLGSTAQSPAVRRVPGLRVGDVSLTPPGGDADGAVSAPVTLAPGTTYRATEHIVSILLLDAESGAPVPLDYASDTTMDTDAAGNVGATSVRIPAGLTLPDRVEAVVMTDAFPAKRFVLQPGGAS